MAKKILLADDSITIQKVVELTFSDGDYEVTAVNNGSKAIQKLSEMRPDIILSDIIMPEKNGYEVCEYVKSHPEYRNIPVVLLTGTFEPFDPDRADKAGCDAVVTKPFESQSLIHKVEELIEQAAAARASASHAAPAVVAPAAAPAGFTAPYSAPQPVEEEESPFAPLGTGSESPFASEFQSHGSEIFQGHNEDSSNAPTTEMPLDDAPASFEGETRAFPRMSFEDLNNTATPAAEPVPVRNPWDQPEASQQTADTHEEPSSYAASAPVEPEPVREPSSPWDEPETTNAPTETRAFPRMSFEDLQRATDPLPETPAPSPAPEPSSPWDEPEQPAYGGETRAFPRMSFEDLQAASSNANPTPAEPEPAVEDIETTTSAFSSQGSAWSEPDQDSSSWLSNSSENDLQPEPVSETPTQEPFANESFGGHEENMFAAEQPVHEESPFASPEPDEPEPQAEPAHPSWAPRGADVVPLHALPSEPEFPAEDHSVAQQHEPEEVPAAASANHSSDLTDDQIDRIARRVVELMSEKVVTDIAWQVIPDLAEVVVRERIRQLEGES